MDGAGGQREPPAVGEQQPRRAGVARAGGGREHGVREVDADHGAGGSDQGPQRGQARPLPQPRSSAC
ncbi:hypothetical protein [Streptomyces sp. H34-S4]|uniref:hypothetical protein n=1 Tax=Streptomyces sp. H34-S4 TaxID=2996463 RepID=UPI003B63854F